MIQFEKDLIFIYKNIFSLEDLRMAIFLRYSQLFGLFLPAYSHKVYSYKKAYIFYYITSFYYIKVHQDKQHHTHQDNKPYNTFVIMSKGSSVTNSISKIFTMYYFQLVKHLSITSNFTSRTTSNARRIQMLVSSSVTLFWGLGRIRESEAQS